MRILVFLILFIHLNLCLQCSEKSCENDIIQIHLEKNIAISDAEFSGLDWYENELILLPQYPDRFESDFNGCLFSISKSEITNYLKSEKKNPILPKKISFNSGGIESQFNGFEGYEAIVFNGQDVYLAIESEIQGKMSAYIIKGKIDSNKNEITLYPNSLKEIPLFVNLENMAIEALIIIENRVLAIYEANGKNINEQPKIVSFDFDLKNYEILTFQNIEYRITDATRIFNNDFWVINYLYKGDKKLLNPAEDNLSRYPTNNEKVQTVERLVQFQVENGAIKLSNKPPIQIELRDNEKSRNWEGIVKYDSLGFLIITDKFPRTILAYIPYPLGMNDLMVYEEDSKYGYKNTLDVNIIVSQYNYAQEFSKFGIAAVVDDSGWVYINKQGENIIRPHVVDNGPDYFSFGLARLKSKNKYGYFDEWGNVVIKPEFDYARSFVDSMAAVCQGCQFIRIGEHDEVIGGKWGFINIKGELQIPFIYDKVSNFDNGSAKVEKKGKSTTISRYN